MRKEYRRSLIKFSNYSLCVTLPKTMLKKMSLDKGDDVLITMRRGKIILEPIVGGTKEDIANGDQDDETQDESWEPMPEIKKK
jgi:antitoxin component of MazEF toxin-antitoxin module